MRLHLTINKDISHEKYNNFSACLSLNWIWYISRRWHSHQVKHYRKANHPFYDGKTIIEMIALNPAKLKRLFSTIKPISLWCFLISAPIALFYALYISPPDYLHGDLVRILYIHVPAAWFAVGIYTVMGLCSFASLVLRSSFYSLCAQSLALPGCVLTIICMLTGAIWGKPAWGTWWVWDARLTSVVVLFFLYVGYINFCDGGLNKAASVLNVVGLINVPIIKWSVDWWFTLHQPSSFFLTKKPAIATEMLVPLLLMTVVFASWVLAVFTRRFFVNMEEFQRRHSGIF